MFNKRELKLWFIGCSHVKNKTNCEYSADQTAHCNESNTKHRNSIKTGVKLGIVRTVGYIGNDVPFEKKTRPRQKGKHVLKRQRRHHICTAKKAKNSPNTVRKLHRRTGAYLLGKQRARNLLGNPNRSA